ncbi:MAG TPA: ABC transporter substrate-binding protein, partial [Nautiliaceae bacterium]|nr:ABC transporter substrate-binding protein [Nautiliaceae bacterium]
MATNKNYVILILGLILVVLVLVFAFLMVNKGNETKNNEIREIKPEGPKISEPKPLKRVVVAQWGHTYYLIYLPFYVAIDRGFFKEEGLDVEIKFSGNDDQVFATVIGGEAMFGIGDPVFAAVAYEKRGIEGRVVGLIVGKVALWGITNKDNVKEIKTYRDLDGLTIGTFPAPSTTYTIVNNIIQEYKLNSRIKQAPIGSQLSLLEKGAADVVMLLEPSASIAEVERGYRVVMSMPRLWGNFAFTGLTTTKEWIEKDPQTVRKFLRAMQKALDYI